MKQFFTQILHSIYPQTCHLCKKIIEKDGSFCHTCWNELTFIRDPYCCACGLPLPFTPSFDVHAAVKCNDCLQDLPVFESCRSAVKYSDALQKLIIGFKQYDQTYTLPIFTKWLVDLTNSIDDLSSYILVPVPIHYYKMLNRHYNQAALLAKSLGKTLALKCWLNALIRTKHTKPQGTMSRRERLKNVSHVFALNDTYSECIKGQNIILIDDVYTTGSTVKACSKILLKAGAKTVRILTLARTVKQM